MPSPEKKRALYWRAVSALREAETLADLGSVSGPADAPPKEGEDESWIKDWGKRAQNAIRKAHEALVDNPSEAVKRRAQRIGARVQSGITAIKKAFTPSEETKKKLRSLSDLAKGLLFAGNAGSAAGLIVGFALVYWWFSRKG